MSHYFDIEILKRKKLSLRYYGVERFMENYLLKFPKRSKEQALKFAEKKVYEKIKEIDNYIKYLENDNLQIVTPRVYNIS